ncbi:hypothetical protein [Neotabrizicola sp. sgz301269]|uniref:hypothetical protein n=1 Tax=Neotabrizicola sp. sgz301269 TaxID=3276282 RepID=UPI00376FC5DE
MNPIPFLALGLIASGYAAFSSDITARVAAEPAQIVAYPAYAGTDQLSIYDMPGVTPDDAFDRPVCQDSATMVASLDHDFAETLVDTSLQADGLVMELYASTLMGTWTLVHKGDDGISCVVTSGIGWTDTATPDQVLEQSNVAS